MTSHSAELSEHHSRRLKAVAACCTTLGSACLLLAACSTGNVRKPVAPVAEPAAVPAPTTPVAPSAASTVDMAVTPVFDIASPWPRLLARYAMPDCDADPTVRKFARAM